jgi:ATP-dependent DNA helicase, recQ family
MSFERKNVAYVVRKTDNKISELLHILQSVPGTAIVYCRSRDRTKQIAQNIEKFGISATWFHAGLERAEKEQRQNDWQGNKIRVIVATNAFGMGIDKPDVRLVVHADFPSSLEAYFQEAGRVGRDGKKGYAVLLYSPGADERQLKKRGTDTFPPKDYIRTVYNHLAYFYQIGVGSGYGARMEFPIDKFCGIFKHFPIQVNSALHILHRAGYIFYEEDPDTRARVHFLLERDELYRLDALSEKENEVITSLLRNYGGLFSEFRYIDESLLAHEACIERNEAYMILKGLAKKRIIDFIPRKNIPLITYTRDREETSRIVFTKEVYEQIKEQYENQISAIMEYAEKDYICRSRQLLRYFGETKSNDCCICDVCLSSEKQPETKLVKMKKLILGMLSDGKKHLVTELLQFRSKTPEFEKEVISPVLQSMLAEEEIIMDGNYIYISRMRDE